MKNIIAKYEHYRKQATNLNEELFKQLSTSDIKIAARLLGILKKDALIIDSEEEMGRFSDFAIHDYRNRDSKTAVDKYKEKNNFGKSNSDEEKILEALLVSKSSLFEVTGIDKKLSIVYLHDIFNEGRELEIIDIGFSLSGKIEEFLLFSRVVSIDGMQMTSGAPLLFEKGKEAVLREKYRKLYKKIVIKNEQTKMTIAFFKLNKSIGYNVQYM